MEKLNAAPDGNFWKATPPNPPMNTIPTIKITEEGPEVGVATARLLLQHALEQEEQNEDGDNPDLARKRAINAHTGASALLPPTVVPDEEPEIEKKPSATDGATGS